MPDIAVLTNDDGAIEIVHAEDCNEADRGKPYSCPECGCSMFLRMGIGIKKHFYGDHATDCKTGSGKYRLAVTETGHILALDALLKHVDTPVPDEEIATPVGKQGKHESSPETEDEKFTIFAPGIKALTNIRSMYDYALSSPLNEVIDVETGLTCKDFIVNGNTIFDCRRNGFDGEVRLAVTSRIAPSTLKNAPHKQGYILLRDAFSRDNNDAIYFLIRIKEPSQYDKFRKLLFGTKEQPELKCPKKRILLLANWRRLSGTDYHVYYASINSKCYAFI